MASSEYAQLVEFLGQHSSRRSAVASRRSSILALHTGAPLFVTPEMLDHLDVVMTRTALDQLEEYVSRKREAKNEAPEVPAMAWQWFRSLPPAENPGITGP